MIDSCHDYRMALFRRHPSAGRPAPHSASWLAYPTLTHGDAGMVKFVGGHIYRKEATEVLRHFGPLVLAELRIEHSGPYAGAVRVYVGDAQVGTVPSELADAFREAVETLTSNGQPATIHVELDVGEYVDVWGLCKPQPRQEGEPLLPTQYREDVQLFDGIAAALDASLNSRAKEKKTRRKGEVSLGVDGTWTVSDGGHAIGTLVSKPYKRLHELMHAGLPLEVVVTIHRRTGRPLSVHVSIPPDA